MFKLLHSTLKCPLVLGTFRGEKGKEERRKLREETEGRKREKQVGIRREKGVLRQT